MRNILALSAVLLSTTPALAQQTAMPIHCDEAAKITGLLSGQYGEAVVAMGINGDGSLAAQLWVNEETGSWTWVFMSADGSTACHVASGQAWQNGGFEPPLTGSSL